SSIAPSLSDGARGHGPEAGGQRVLERLPRFLAHAEPGADLLACASPADAIAGHGIEHAHLDARGFDGHAPLPVIPDACSVSGKRAGTQRPTPRSDHIALRESCAGFRVPFRSLCSLHGPGMTAVAIMTSA